MTERTCENCHIVHDISDYEEKNHKLFGKILVCPECGKQYKRVMISVSTFQYLLKLSKGFFNDLKGDKNGNI